MTTRHVRWMVQNFPELRQKNNLDLSTKRLRLNEYIASLLSIKLGESVKLAHNCLTAGISFGTISNQNNWFNDYKDSSEFKTAVA